MASVGLSEASRLTGEPRSTIHRAMRDGRLSYTLAPDGGRQIEVAELERVYPTKAPGGGATVASHGAQDKLKHLELVAQLAMERARVALLEDMLADTRRRLDSESDERRRLTALLTAQQPVIQTATPRRSRRWWPWRR